MYAALKSLSVQAGSTLFSVAAAEVSSGSSLDVVNAGAKITVCQFPLVHFSFSMGCAGGPSLLAFGTSRLPLNVWSSIGASHLS